MRMGCDPVSRNGAAASGLGSSQGPLRSMPASHRASDDVEQAPGLAVLTPRMSASMRLRSCDRRDDARSCHGLPSLSRVDHSVHSPAHGDPVVTSTITGVVCGLRPQTQLQDVDEASGWAAQTPLTSSTMVMDP